MLSQKLISLIFIICFISALQIPAQWVKANGPYGGISHLAVSGSTVFAGAQDLYRSTDNGTNWTRLDLSIQFVRALAANKTKIFMASTQGIYVSGDNGDSWVKTGNIVVSSFAFLGKNIFAVDELSKGIYISTDDGANWASLNSTIDTLSIFAIATTGSYIMAAGRTNIYYNVYFSSDYGTSWNLTTNNLPGIIISSLAAKDSVLFIGSTYNGIFRSSDKGKNWLQVNNGLKIYNNTVTCFGFRGDSIFIGTSMGFPFQRITGITGKS